jgi:hypothetical protein
MSHFLNESPIHFIDAVRNYVNANNFSEDVALMMLAIMVMVKKMHNYDDDAVRRISTSNALVTATACKSHQRSINSQTINHFAQNFTANNKAKILNDLNHIQSQLLQIYQDAGINVHNDI